MLSTLGIIGLIYVTILFFLARSTRSQDKTTKQYLLAGSSLGAVLGFFTIAATLFSTFSLLGMPDFFKRHGVGAWVFLMISHCVMAFGIVWIGHALRKRTNRETWTGMAGFIRDNFRSPVAGVVIFMGVFLFLLPYIAIQIRGVAIFLQASFPQSIPMSAWASLLVAIMIIYSEVGGLKAIMYSDVLQGILLLIAIWIIGYNCLNHFGGLQAMFDEVEKVDVRLLSTPGPLGLFDFQFLLGSIVAIFLVPYTQPQISTRLVILKDDGALYKMAIGLGLFGIIIILPTVFMGMYGAVLYGDNSTSEFLNNTYVGDQTHFIASVVMIGIIAAAISTSDSQLFALGGELRSILTGEDKKMVTYARIGIFSFAVAALALALMSSDQLALLARTSFAGTALLAPMIFTGTFYERAYKITLLPWCTGLVLIIFALSSVHVIPHDVNGLRMDLLCLAFLTVVALVSIFIDRRSGD